MSPRTSFNSSQLVRELAALQTRAASTTAPAGTLAEHLGGWLGWTDAIALAAVLPGGGGEAGAARQRLRPRGRIAARAARVAAPTAAALREECDRVRDELARAIDAEAAGQPAADADEAPWAPWRRRATALQRTMDARVAALRARLRAALQAGSDRLQALAALDAVLDDALRARERHLLAGATGLFESHARRTGGDAEALAATWRAVMHAELDLRLQPALGLLDAVHEEPAAEEAEIR